MHRSTPATALAFAFLALGCGGSSTPPGAIDEDTGTVGDSAGKDTSTGGDTLTTGDTLVPPGDGGGCPHVTDGTFGVHVIMKVSWPGTIGTDPGSGNVNVWTRSKFTVDGANAITATNSACGSLIPDIQTTPIAGGAKVQAEFPAALWNAPSMPTFAATGTQNGFDVGSTITIVASPVLLGLTMTDPKAAWPAATAITGADSDGDGKLGITAVPKVATGYDQPPTSLLRTNKADKLYIASRITVTTNGTRTACDAQSGPATVANFDNHIIGCHVAGGGECSAGDAKFIDDNRTVYKVDSATFESKLMPGSPTCDEVRALLPAK
ncbi:MAG: hypothetical protein ABI175_11660 [Polyangiales bacterium]